MRVAVAFVLLVSCARAPLQPLTIAARDGNAPEIRALVARGADANAFDGVNDWTPLEHAVHKHQPAAITALLDVGADPNRADPRGSTPLMMAAGYGSTDIVQLLLRRGADLRLRDSGGATALDWAVSGINDIDRFTLFDCQAPTIEVLRKAGAPAGTDKSIAKLKRC